MASVYSQKELDILHDLAGERGAWIGLTDFLDEGKWDKWVDGTAVDFTLANRTWRTGQPNNHNDNQHCIWIRPDGRWDDITCKHQRQYVCQKPYVKLVVV